MLGLSESMTGKSIGLRLKRASGRRRFFIPRKEFQEFLREHGDFCMQVVRLLSEDLHGLTTNSAASVRTRGVRGAGRWMSTLN
jgi:CRP-like cAMP-binding protein